MHSGRTRYSGHRANPLDIVALTHSTCKSIRRKKAADEEEEQQAFEVMKLLPAADEERS
jgi:hypothetical protein